MKRIIGIIIIILLFSGKIVYPLTADNIEIANDRDYFGKIHWLLSESKKSIYLLMFSAHYYDRYPDSPTNILLRDLANAKKRGVDVKVVLEQEPEEREGIFGKKKIQPDHQGAVKAFLDRNNIPCVMDNPLVTLHAKVIIVDGLYTVIGSTNWSYGAMEKNKETAVIIESPETADCYQKYFDRLFTGRE